MPERSPTKKRSPVKPRAAGPKARDLRDDVAEFKRDLILRTAVEIFFEKGFQATTVDEIAAAMSVSKAVVYWNFASKNDVLDAIVDRAIIKLTRIAQYIDPARSPAQNLAEFCFRHAAVVLANQKEVAVYLFEMRHRSADLQRRVKALQTPVLRALTEQLEAGVRSGEFRMSDPQLVVYDILSMIIMSFIMSFDWRWHYGVQRHTVQNLSLHFADQALRLAGYAGEFPFKEGELVVGQGES
jgi:AcrR family transcriptional regulator